MTENPDLRVLLDDAQRRNRELDAANTELARESLRLREALKNILEVALLVHANEHMANFQCGVIAGTAQKALIER